jgi:hypothetical protein
MSKKDRLPVYRPVDCRAFLPLFLNPKVASAGRVGIMRIFATSLKDVPIDYD